VLGPESTALAHKAKRRLHVGVMWLYASQGGLPITYRPDFEIAKAIGALRGHARGKTSCSDAAALERQCVILFSNNGFFRVSAVGGSPVRVTEVDIRAGGHPWFCSMADIISSPTMKSVLVGTTGR
jgi:hypothetical protein